MDNIFAIPQLSGVHFTYTRLPHVSHAVFCSGPISGTYALPQHIPGHLVAHLTRQALAQSRLLGAAPTAVAHAPPPPGRGRSTARGVSRVRAAPVNPPVPAPKAFCLCLGLEFGPFLCLTFSRGDLDIFRSPGRCSCARLFGRQSRCENSRRTRFPTCPYAARPAAFPRGTCSSARY